MNAIALLYRLAARIAGRIASLGTSLIPLALRLPLTASLGFHLALAGTLAGTLACRSHTGGPTSHAAPGAFCLCNTGDGKCRYSRDHGEKFQCFHDDSPNAIEGNYPRRPMPLLPCPPPIPVVLPLPEPDVPC